MSARPLPVRVAAAGLLDREGLVGRGPPGRREFAVRWSELSLDPFERLPWRLLHDAPFPTFRRLDRFTQHVCLAAEAADLEATFAALSGARDDPDGEGLVQSAASAALRAETALVLGTSVGCLAADLRFARSLAPDVDLEPAVFPYTLPSTCLGELAIRHGLRGPTRCFMTLPGEDGQAFAEGAALIAAGEARAALVGVGNALSPEDAERCGIEPQVGFAVVLLVGGEHEPRSAAPPPNCEALARAQNPLALLGAWLRAGRSAGAGRREQAP